MIEEKLENFRKVYIGSGKYDFAPPDILAGLPAQNRPHAYLLKALIVVLAVVLLTGSAFGAAQAANPGTRLYPLKLLSDEVLARITGKEELKVEKRAQEVINSTGASQKQQEEALEQFQKTLEETKKEAKESGRTQEFRQTLDSEENKFKNAQEKNPSQHLEQAIKQTQNAKGEVEGQKDQQSPGQGNQNSNNRNDHGQNQGQNQNSPKK